MWEARWTWCHSVQLLVWSATTLLLMASETTGSSAMAVNNAVILYGPLEHVTPSADSAEASRLCVDVTAIVEGSLQQKAQRVCQVSEKDSALFKIKLAAGDGNGFNIFVDERSSHDRSSSRDGVAMKTASVTCVQAVAGAVLSWSVEVPITGPLVKVDIDMARLMQHTPRDKAEESKPVIDHSEASPAAEMHLAARGSNSMRTAVSSDEDDAVHVGRITNSIALADLFDQLRDHLSRMPLAQDEHLVADPTKLADLLGMVHLLATSCPADMLAHDRLPWLGISLVEALTCERMHGAVPSASPSHQGVEVAPRASESVHNVTDVLVNEVQSGMASMMCWLACCVPMLLIMLLLHALSPGIACRTYSSAELDTGSVPSSQLNTAQPHKHHHQPTQAQGQSAVITLARTAISGVQRRLSMGGPRPMAEYAQHALAAVQQRLSSTGRTSPLRDGAASRLAGLKANMFYASAPAPHGWARDGDGRLIRHGEGGGPSPAWDGAAGANRASWVSLQD